MRKCISLLFLLGLVLISGCARIRPPSGAKAISRTMTVTGYCKCRKCCSWHRDWLFRPVYNSSGKRKIIGQTASGSMAKIGTIAADKKYAFGTVMYIEGYGYGKVEDRGGAVKGEHIDLYFRHHAQALKWGKKTKKVKIWLTPKRR